MTDNKIKQYKAIGYWHSEEEPYFPDPAWFIDEAWDDTEKQTVIEYLKKGTALAHYRGFSWCRFKCSGGYGSADMTDGTYIYPEGLVHYLENHHIKLPDAFINHIKGIVEKPLSFMARTLSYFSKGKNIVSHSFGEMDYDWWLSQKGCNPNHLSYKEMTKTIKKSFNSREEGIRFWETEKDNPDLIRSEMNMPSWLQYTGEFWGKLDIKKNATDEKTVMLVQHVIEFVTDQLDKVALGENYSCDLLYSGPDANGESFTFIIACSKPFYDRIQHKEYGWAKFSKKDWTEIKELDLELNYRKV